MSPGAKTHWRRLVRQLHRAGLVTHIDGMSLKLLSESIDLYESASAKITANTLVVKTVSGNVIQNPFLSIRNSAWDQIFKLAGRFGLTPADRNGMSFSFVPGGQDSISAFARDRKDRFFADTPWHSQKPQ